MHSKFSELLGFQILVLKVKVLRCESSNLNNSAMYSIPWAIWFSIIVLFYDLEAKHVAMCAPN